MYLFFFNTNEQFLISMDYEKFRYEIDAGSIEKFFYTLIDKKQNEFFLALALLVIFFYSKFKKKNNLLNYKNSFYIVFSKNIVLSFLFIFSILIVNYKSSKSGLIRNIFYGEKNLVVYISWFDFSRIQNNWTYKELKCLRSNNCKL